MKQVFTDNLKFKKKRYIDLADEINICNTSYFYAPYHLVNYATFLLIFIVLHLCSEIMYNKQCVHPET